MTTTIRRASERGHANHGWLDAHHTFSFASYQDPAWVRWSVLRVINQDRIAPSAGFQTHGHEDMEIITYVLDGLLEHKDSMGNGSVIRPGEVQFMSAGSGVTHSEFNGSSEDETHLLQMWIFPAEKGTEPRYDQRSFSEAQRRGQLRLVVSPDGAEGSVQIGQDASMYAAILERDDQVEHAFAPGRKGWLHVAKGKLALDGELLGPGDGAGFDDQGTIALRGVEQAELVLFDLP